MPDWLPFALTGAAAGGLLVLLALALPARRTARAADARIAGLEAELKGERDKAATAAAEAAASRAVAARVPSLEENVAALQSELRQSALALEREATSRAAEHRAHAAREAQLVEMGEEIQRKLAVLATETLARNSETFLQLASERFQTHQQAAAKELDERKVAIEGLLQPVGETLTRFEGKVGELEAARQNAFGAIEAQLRLMTEGQSQLRGETARLVQSLRNPQARGRWGEFRLRNVLEIAGMTPHVDFNEQQSIRTPDGMLRPDATVRLPGGKEIVVDAKTPLDAYLSAIDATDEASRARYLADHARHLRTHARQLASQEYWKALPGTPDFVVMFVPGEAFFAAAIEQDPNLFEQALKDRVVVCTPTIFVAVLKAIAYAWQQERLARNAEEVGRLARELFDRLKTFGKHLDGVGKGLRTALTSYNSAVGSMEGRVLATARKFETLGVTAAGETLPDLSPVEIEPRALMAPEFISAAPSPAPEPADAPAAGATSG